MNFPYSPPLSLTRAHRSRPKYQEGSIFQCIHCMALALCRTEEGILLVSLSLANCFCQGDKIQIVMGQPGSMHDRAFRLLIGNPPQKRPLGISKNRLEDNIKIDLEKTECKDSEQGPVTGYCKRNVNSGSQKQQISWSTQYQHFNECSIRLNWFCSQSVSWLGCWFVRQLAAYLLASRRLSGIFILVSPVSEE